MAYNYEGALGGILSGVGAGASLGPIGAIGGGILGGLLGGGKKKKTPTYTAPDISGELAKIDALYGQQGQLLTQGINQQIANMQGQTAQGLANRGIYSSPVSQKAIQDVNTKGLQALAQGQASLLGEQAQARTSALNNLLGYQQRAQQANNEIAMQKYLGQNQTNQGLLAMGGGLLSKYLTNRPRNANMNTLDVGTEDALNKYFGNTGGKLNLF